MFSSTSICDRRLCASCTNSGGDDGNPPSHWRGTDKSALVFCAICLPRSSSLPLYPETRPVSEDISV